MYTLAILSFPDHTLVEEKTLAEWGISGVQVSQANATASKLSFTLTVAQYDADHPFAYRTPISLRHNGQQVWLGYITTTPRSATGTDESISITAEDVLWWLTRFAVEFDWEVSAGNQIGWGLNSYVVPDGKAAVNSMQRGTQYVRIGDTAERTTTATEYARVARLAQQRGVPALWADPALPAYSPPPQRSTNKTALDTLRGLLQWHPSAMIWVDYSTTPATIRCADGSAEAPVAPVGLLTLRPSVPITVAGWTPGLIHGGDTYRPASLGEIRIGATDGDMDVEDLADLIPAGVVIHYQGADVDPAPTAVIGDLSVDLTPAYIHRWPAETPATGLDVVAQTIDWRDLPLPSTNLAKLWHQSLSALRWKGSCTLVAETVQIGSHLGHTINIDGGRPEWAEMNGLIQQVDYDIDTGTTTIRFGPVPHWTLQDWVTLFFRRQSDVGAPTDTRRDWGAGDISIPPDRPADPDDPDNEDQWEKEALHVIWMCRNGKPARLRVKGQWEKEVTPP